MRTISKIKKGQEKLTPAQERYAKKFAQRQIERYLSTEQVLSDKEVERCVLNAYKVSLTKLPKKVRWLDSPEAFCRVGASVWASVGDSVWASVGDSVWASVRASVRASVGASVRASVGDSVWASVRASVGDSVWASVGDSVWASVRDSVRDSVRAYYDANWLSFYEFFNENFKKNNLVWLAKVSENTTGYGLFEKEAWLVRNPVILTRDEQGRLHGETDMAIKWKDQTGYYFWHGTKVSEKIVKNPEGLTKDDWVNESNLEVRRVIQDRMPDFVEKIGAKEISKDKWGKLYEIDLPNDPEKVARYVKVKDASTPRSYYLRVPPTVQTPKAAVAWTFGLEENSYLPIKQT